MPGLEPRTYGRRVSSPLPGDTPENLPDTVGALRACGHRYRTVKDEIRENLLARMRSGEPRFPGVVGFDETVLPDLERALLAGHDVVLLGERGQGKTRLIRTVVTLLDEWTPVIAGAELHEHPFHPITPASRRRAAELGDDLPVAWVHRDERYAEKLATPDTSVGDLIGDVDPIKVAEGRTLGDPETIHFGLVPRTHRGIFAVNELPDLAERIQVSLLNVLEERDIQVRGYVLRLPLDVLLVASANPEDYTNRGRIITPLKDRFGAEIRTHYPLDVDVEIDLVRQEAQLVAEVPEHLLEVMARFTRAVRESPAVDSRSGVSARFAIAAAETLAAAALRRAALLGELAEGPRGAVAPWPGSGTPRACPPPCAARSSSRRTVRAARRRSSSTCCDAASPRRGGPGSAASTSAGSSGSSRTGTGSPPATGCPPANCSSRSAACPASPRCWRGSDSTRCRPRRGRHRRSNSCSRACT